MMNTEKTLPCAVVRDLLPLYAEQLCSDESTELITEHLSACDPCASQLTAMQAELPSISTDAPGADSLSALRRTYRTIRIRTLLLCMAAAIVLFCGLMGLDSILRQPNVPLTAQEMDGTVLYVSEDQKLFYRIGTNQYSLSASSGRIMPDLETETIYLEMSRPSWPYARKNAPSADDGGTPNDDPVADLFRAELIDGDYVAQIRDGEGGTVPMRVMAVMVGNEKDGYEPLWRFGEPLSPLPEGITARTSPEF